MTVIIFSSASNDATYSKLSHGLHLIECITHQPQHAVLLQQDYKSYVSASKLVICITVKGLAGVLLHSCQLFIQSV